MSGRDLLSCVRKRVGLRAGQQINLVIGHVGEFVDCTDPLCQLLPIMPHQNAASICEACHDYVLHRARRLVPSNAGLSGERDPVELWPSIYR